MAQLHQFGVTACIGSFLLQGNPLQLCHKANSKPRFITNNDGNVWHRHHGWHMSYFGSPLWIRQKLNSYAETKTNRAPYNALTYIVDHAYKGLDLLEQSCYNWTYVNSDKIGQMGPAKGPWFYLANKKHRPSFHRYGDPLRDGVDTHCIILEDVQGSLGEQLFSIISVFSRAFKLGVPYVLPLHSTKNKLLYWDSDFFKNIASDSYSLRDCSPYMTVPISDPRDGMPQWIDAKEKSYTVSGFMLNKTDLKGEGLKNVLHNRLINPTSLKWKVQHSQGGGKMLMIGAESNLDTNILPPWGNAIGKAYYEKAIKAIDLSKYASIHIFGDSSKVGTVEKLVEAAKKTKTSVFIWKEQEDTIALHLSYMTMCDDFIVGAGLAHFWGAFLSISPDKKVFYPDSYQHGHSFIPHIWQKI